MSDCAETNGACPRCGQVFRCGVDDATPCACTRFALDDTTLAALNREYRGCLCPRCLAELAARPAESASG